MNNLEELKSLIVLNNIPTLGPVRIKRLIEFFGSATKVLSATEGWSKGYPLRKDFKLPEGA
jgi:hypothetical protein